MLPLTIVLLVVGVIVSLIGGIMMIVAAFRVSTLWGLAVIFVPFASLVFLVKYWAEAKRSFIISVAGGAVSMAAWALLFFTLADSAGAAVARAAAEAGQERPEPAAEGSGRLAQATPQPAAAAPVAATAAAPAPGAGAGTAAETEGTGDGLDTPPEDADEVAAFEQLAKATGPDTLNSEIRPRDLANHIGEKLIVVEQNGDEVRGTLLGVDKRTLRIERDLSGGSVRYEIARADVKQVRQAQ